MADLSELSLDIAYRSDVGNVVSDFYVPCLIRSKIYRRAAGYFTSSGLALAAKGVAHLIKTGGKVQLVVSPHLSEADLEAIELGYKGRNEVLQQAAQREIGDPENELIKNRLSALAWLISMGALDIKLAFRIDPLTGRLRRGLYHEKIGIFSDDGDHHVAFTGSQNETEGGLVENFESIDVYCSWIDSQRRVDRKIKAFEELWSDATPGLSVIDFNQVSKELLNRFKTKEPPEFEPDFFDPIELKNEDKRSVGKPAIPSTVTLRDYQENAINNWLKANGRGILQMATGTGKTITALGLSIKLIEKIDLQAVIIVCPYKHLVSQWAKECVNFGFDPLLAFESRATWFDVLTRRLSSLHNNPEKIVCVITTNKTLASDGFQQRLKYFPQRTLFIADEVHNLGAAHLGQSLPQSLNLRLGLSATPERWFDQQGTDRLIAYFGEVLEPRLGIKEAIDLKVLVPYRYFPILIKLTEDEQEQYLNLSARIGRLFGFGGETSDNPALNALLIQRARIVASAINKLDALRAFGLNHRDAKQMLFYCGDGSVENPDDKYYVRQVDEVVRLLGVELGIRVAPYTAETEMDERDQLKDDLADGRLQGLVAIRCLDEGIDIPSVKTAVILASSTNPRQFIQRRGRVLRRAPGKEYAEIFDMIVIPPEGSSKSEAERSLIRKELTRFREFADIALNAGEALASILDLQRQFDLMDI